MRSLVQFPWAQGSVRPAASDPFAFLQSEVNRIFDGMGRFGPLTEFAAASPRLDISETSDAIEIHAELPGVAEKDVELTLTGDLLTIKGEKHEAKEDKGRDFHLTERSYGAFTRSVRLPFAAAPESAKASFDKGILTIAIPKPKEQREKSARIPIK
jgi:HSP20 family protein